MSITVLTEPWREDASDCAVKWRKSIFQENSHVTQKKCYSDQPWYAPHTSRSRTIDETKWTRVKAVDSGVKCINYSLTNCLLELYGAQHFFPSSHGVQALHLENLEWCHKTFTGPALQHSQSNKSALGLFLSSFDVAHRVGITLLFLHLNSRFTFWLHPWTPACAFTTSQCQLWESTASCVQTSCWITPPLFDKTLMG